MSKRFRVLLWVIGGLLLSGLLLLTIPVDGRLRDLEGNYGIQISLDQVEYPPGWEGMVTDHGDIPWYDRLSALRKLKLDLSRYPAGFLPRVLEHVYVFEKLQLAGRDYGGTTYAPDGRLYIAGGWLGDDGSSPDAMGFHHELSSLLLSRFSAMIDRQAWMSANPAEFDYRFDVSSHLNLDQKDYLRLSGSDDIYQQGFIAPYGMLTWEDDVNTVAQYYFGKPNATNDLVDRYPNIASKVKIFSEFIDRINRSSQ